MDQQRNNKIYKKFLRIKVERAIRNWKSYKLGLKPGRIYLKPITF